MNIKPEKFVFTVHSPSYAQLTVVREKSSFGMGFDPDKVSSCLCANTGQTILLKMVHRLGFYASPRFEIEQFHEPEEDVAIRVNAKGSDLPSTWEPLSVEEKELAAWAAGSQAKNGLGIFSQLPTGRYALVRTAIKQQLPKVIKEMERPINNLLLRVEPCYINIFGPGPGRPSLDRPLLGVPVLHMQGGKRAQILFFSMTGEHNVIEQASWDDSKELLLIIPYEGELIIDNMAGFHDEREAMQNWRDKQAPALINWLLNQPNNL